MINLMKPPPELRRGFKDPKRMEAIHNIPCSLCYLKGWTQKTITTAHHKHGEGMGLKVSDLLTCSLCASHHQTGQDAFHHIGRVAFEKKFNTTQDDLILLTNKLLDKA